MGIQIIVDSCCDTTPELRNRIGMLFAPLKVQVADGPQYTDTPALDTRKLLREMKASKQAAGSACPSVEEYAEQMRRCDACIVVTLSGKLSGSYNSARVARDMVLEESPGKQIHILDSESASAGELRLALYLKELIDAGEDFDTVVEKSTRFMESMRTLFVLEDLGNLVKNGRLNKVSGIVASVLSLCPIMSDDGHGEIRMAAKARGMKQALMKLTSLIAQETAFAAPRSLTLTMAYCNCPERAGLLRGGILESCPAVGRVIIVPTGGVSTVYANDGGIIVAYAAV